VDLGAYDGDSVREMENLFHEEGVDGPRRIYAMEPDPRNFRKLEQSLAGKKNVCAVQAASWEKPGVLRLFGCGGRQSGLFASGGHRRVKAVEVPAESVDHLLGAKALSIMKLDVEGAEVPALLGAKEHLSSKRTGRRPRMMIAAYHHDSDLFRIPETVWDIRPDYKIYLRKHPYVPCWELNFFTV